MPLTRATFATGRRSIIYSRVSAILRASPRLAAVNTFILGDGAVEDMVEPSVTMMPWIRARPETRSLTRVAETRNFVEFAVRLEIATAGTSWHDFLNLWDAIEAAFYQDEPVMIEGATPTTVRDYLTGRSQGRCDGALFGGIDQDASFSLFDQQKNTIARMGYGRIIFPLTKRA